MPCKGTCPEDWDERGGDSEDGERPDIQPPWDDCECEWPLVRWIVEDQSAAPELVENTPASSEHFQLLGISFPRTMKRIKGKPLLW